MMEEIYLLSRWAADPAIEYLGKDGMPTCNLRKARVFVSLEEAQTAERKYKDDGYSLTMLPWMQTVLSTRNS